ncbi:MAG: protein kinase [Polyangiaceae bacterium]
MEHEDEFGIVGVTLANAFHVERVVAHGGFAIVYRGIHGGFRAPIALKCLRIPSGMTPAQHTTFLERFREEGELLFRLSAAIPEVVRPLHIDAVVLPTGQLMPFLALEWLEGEGFDQVIARHRRERRAGLDLITLIDTLRPVAHALSRAHHFPTERGSICIVHRDLKPENLFVCNVAGAPVIKILDYGIAEVVSVVQRVSGARGFRGMNPFTPGYGAPEQWAPDRFGTSGAWTDVWGLALTMTEALLGRPAIDGDLETMRRAALDPRRRPTPRSVGCTVSNDVEAVFQQALALDPRDRTASIDLFWSEIERAAGAAVTLHPGRVSSPMVRMRRSERELPDSGEEPGIDLDLAVPPESLRNPPRASSPTSTPLAGARPSQASMPAVRPSQASMPAVRPSQASMQAVRPSQASMPAVRPSQASMPAVRPSQASMPAVRPSQASMPAVRPEPEADPFEADLPTHDAPPSSQSVPSSGPRSVRGEPASVRSRALTDSIPPILSPDFVGEEAPLSQRASDHADEPPPSAAPPPASVPRPVVATHSDRPSPVAEVAAVIKARFRVPGLLLVLAIAITLIDLAVVRTGGEPLSLGPVRAFWIAGPLAIIGALLLVWKIVSDD